MRLEMHQKHITAMLKGGGVQVSKLHPGLVAAAHNSEQQPPIFSQQQPASSQLPSLTSMGGQGHGHAGDQSTMSDPSDRPELVMPSASEEFTLDDAADLFEENWQEPDYLLRSIDPEAVLPQPQTHNWDNFYAEN